MLQINIEKTKSCPKEEIEKKGICLNMDEEEKSKRNISYKIWGRQLDNVNNMTCRDEGIDCSAKFLMSKHGSLCCGRLVARASSPMFIPTGLAPPQLLQCIRLLFWSTVDG